MSRYHNVLLAIHLGINETYKLVARKYYWQTPCKDVEAYIQECDICLASKAVKHMFYAKLQSFSVLIHSLKNLLIDFVIDRPISTD